MSLLGVAFRLTLGVLLGHLLPRLPMLILCRTKGFNLRFSPHPAPLRLEPHLTARVLLMRRLWWGVLPLTLIPLLFGAASLRSGNAAFGFGLWAGAGWTAIQRLIALTDAESVPLSMNTAVRLQTVMDACEEETACCALPEPVWEVLSVRCAACRTVLDPLPRPDLGRPRSERLPVAILRLWMADGHALGPSEHQP